MQSNKIFRTIDTHTGGNPTRTVISGVPKLQGMTMSEKMLDMKKNHDWIRKLLMNEPRGHDVMSGVLIVDPCSPEADFGVIYIETGGYLPMCGHDTIGVCTALIESGIVDSVEPITTITLDTPAGLVKTKTEVKNGRTLNVSFENIPSFLLKTIELPVHEINLTNSILQKSIPTITCDIAYGGNFYGIIDARLLGLSLEKSNSSHIIETAIHIRDYINQNFEVIHPGKPFIKGLTHIEFFTDPINPDANLKNTVVVPPGGIDRSPCGTGTSAKLATLYSYGSIKINEPFVHESIVGSIFHARILRTTKIKEYDAVISEIIGSAWVMGMHSFMSSELDELNEGFLLIPEMNEH